MMMRSLWLLLHRLASQKILFFLILFAIVRTLGIFAFHLHALLHGQLRQVPDENYQLPTILLRAVAVAKRGHTGEADPVLDDPEQFAVRKFLRFGQAQIRRLRVHALAVHGVATAVVAMAGSAVIREVCSRLPQRL